MDPFEPCATNVCQIPRRHLLSPTPKTQAYVLFGALLSVGLSFSSRSGADEFSSSNVRPGPEAACVSNGGTYLGDMKCQMRDGSIARILMGDDAIRAQASTNRVVPGSPHAWALATTAITFEFNGYRVKTLAGVTVTPDARQNAVDLLSKWWDVDNRDDLVKVLHWLQFEGHRAGFEALGRQVNAMSRAQFKKASADLSTEPDELHRLILVRKTCRPLGRKGILAWDLVRYISLCRWGYAAGYLSEAEAWDRIMPAALRLQQSFRSWKDLQNDFLIGREYWSKTQNDQTGTQFRSIYKRFLNDKGGPWKENPWMTDLNIANPLDITPNDAEQV